MPLISPADVTVPITVQRRFTARPDVAFDVIAPVDLRALFVKRWPLPGIVRTHGQTGDWDQVGRSRTPELSDGSTVTEVLTEYRHPHSFAYELTGFTGPLRNLVRGIRGEWTFTPDGDDTVVRWTYEFLPRAGRVALVRAILGPLWTRYAYAVVERACELAATSSAAGSVPDVAPIASASRRSASGRRRQ